MRFAALTLSVLAGAATYLTFAQQPGNESINGNWSLHLGDTAGKLRLLLERTSAKHNMAYSRDDVPMSQFAGLTMDQINSAAGSVVHFQIGREAGILECEGFLKSGGGGGVFHFMANLNYMAAMRSLGYRELDNEKIFALSLHDVTTAYVRDMQALGYTSAKYEQLIAMRIHGVSPEFVRDTRALGLRTDSADQLIAMRIHGVSPEFVREMKAQGVEDNSIDRLVAMRIHGVSPDFVRQVKSLGFPNVKTDQLIAMRIHGVTAEFIQKMTSRGMKDLSIDQLVSLKIHGIAN